MALVKEESKTQPTDIAFLMDYYIIILGSRSTQDIYGSV